jgi:hypothetical protein
LLDEAYGTARSETDFHNRLRDQGVKLYVRGKQQGIIGKRKYRLKTLGYSNERLGLLDLGRNQRERELERLVTSRLQEKGLEQNR